MAVMLCHKSKLPDISIICAGWAAIEGYDAIGLRIATLRGKYNPDNLNVDGLELFQSMFEMILAQSEEAQDHPSTTEE